MNPFQRLSRIIIKKSFKSSVWFIELFHDVTIYETKAGELQKMPEGTLGKEIADCLHQNKLRLVPGYESHDLKHVLLDFAMTPEDEIRMQSFMIGNGNYSIPSFSIFIFGAIFLPDLWTTFYKDFIRGRQSVSIVNWNIEEYAHLNIKELRNTLFAAPASTNNNFNINSMIKLGSYIAIVLGTFGMFFCLPFLFSSSVADLVGAGFPFVGGAIIASAGLISLSNLSRNAKNTSQLELAHN